MKQFALAAFCGVCLFAQNSSVRSVYILPMSGGLDQYLAEEITQNHTMLVVANPKAADAVITDHLGGGFEQQMDQIRAKDSEKDKDGDKDDKNKGSDKNNDPHPSFRSGNGTGNVFLVDAKSREVLWSGFEKPSPGKPRRAAERIAKQLQSYGK